jgi:hypothetical protein
MNWIYVAQHRDQWQALVNTASACHLLERWFFAELIFSTLKMDAICSSETSVDTLRTRRRFLYIPENGTLHGNEPSGSIKCWKILSR